MTAITASPELLNVVDEPIKKKKTKARKAKRAKVPTEPAVEEAAAPLLEKAAAEATERYTIDELAAATRVSSRTIRFYQSKGALPRPKIKGRVAYYSEHHVERLGLIAKLQDQGLRIRAIRDLLAKSDRGQLVIGEWLGFKAALQAPWAEDRPRLLDEDELYQLLGDRREGLVGQLLRLKVIKKDRDTYAVRSPALVQIAMKLSAAGIDLETAIDGARVLRKHLSKAAGELADHFFKHTGGNALGGAFDALRPAGMEAVQLIFAQEIERAIAKLIDSGKLPS
jgi:DNA-binding transcriptional MerR regulator